jgi:hypothetical protein
LEGEEGARFHILSCSNYFRTKPIPLPWLAASLIFKKSGSPIFF